VKIAWPFSNGYFHHPVKIAWSFWIGYFYHPVKIADPTRLVYSHRLRLHIIIMFHFIAIDQTGNLLAPCIVG
jgi:hypothetical protein